ncbi:sigma-70 family RNA polymerase sigma factor [Oryzihumus sp.]|jgi:RNA polymerase sigma-B factor|uniref:sigma-70 family RNA polymerase sigma factor n=1 Tax=Oryzihumus sp. TaxID=1968903 RepID=UPI002EDB7287
MPTTTSHRPPAGDPQHVDRRTIHLFEELEQERREAERRRIRNEVVLLNLGMARGIASRYRHRGMEGDDLDQVAYVGLVKATHGFRLAVGHTFPAYACPTISGEIKRHFRDHGWMVRPPRHLQEVHAELRSCAGELGQRLGHDPTAAEVARRAKLTPADTRAASRLDSAYRCASLDAPTGDGTACLGELVAEEGNPFEAVEVRAILGSLLHGLSDAERDLLRLRFAEELSQREIGEVLGISQMQVSRLLSRLISRLRDEAA